MTQSDLPFYHQRSGNGSLEAGKWKWECSKDVAVGSGGLRLKCNTKETQTERKIEWKMTKFKKRSEWATKELEREKKKNRFKIRMNKSKELLNRDNEE